MAKLTYWVAKCLTDSDAYSIRRPTKKAVVAELADQQHNEYEAPKKVTVEYDNAFDLMDQCANEGRFWWES